MTHRTNPLCPSYESHYANAADRLYPEVQVLTPEQDEEVTAEAEAEHLACEGH